MNILTTRGFSAQVDKEDYEYLSQFKWTYNRGYAVRWSKGGRKKRKRIMMHREIMNMGDYDGIHEVDHINRNRLDNRKSNLRVVDRCINMLNKERSGGVWWHSKNKAYYARTTYRNVKYNLGRVENMEHGRKVCREKLMELLERDGIIFLK